MFSSIRNAIIIFFDMIASLFRSAQNGTSALEKTTAELEAQADFWARKQAHKRAQQESEWDTLLSE